MPQKPQPPNRITVPRARRSSSLRLALRRFPRDGQWHRVGEAMGGTTAEQYARRLNFAREILGEDWPWEFGYKSLGDFSELWAVCVPPEGP